MNEEGLRTERLGLRPWRDGDLDAFASMNADPGVMEYFPAPLSRDESAASMARYRAHFDQHGFCFWAVELCADSRFVGALGLSIPRFVAHFTPCVEIGWRLARPYWGAGLASEAARPHHQQASAKRQKDRGAADHRKIARLHMLPHPASPLAPAPKS